LIGETITTPQKADTQIRLIPDYSVRIELFEGPMDLLLYLIEKDELDIYNIRIADITRQYLEYVELMRMLDLDLAGEFLVMAARLMQIKARMLLPFFEEDDEPNPREGLIEALVEYRRIKKAAELMADVESLSRLHHNFRALYDGNQQQENQTELEVNLFDLLRAFREVSLRPIEEEAFHKIPPLTITVEERIQYLLDIISSDKMRFTDIFHPQDSKLMLIVTFVALLELVRLHKISLYQNKPFGEIWISAR